jgi:glycosyltransferase involved in cell wall biosynthesis
VMIEAMACGTPVIAFRRGSVPEVIDDARTGFIVENEAGALEAIKRLKDLDRRGVRNVFERRFTSRRMAQDYLRHYQSLVDNGNTEANSIRPRPESSSGRAGSGKRK